MQFVDYFVLIASAIAGVLLGFSIAWKYYHEKPKRGQVLFDITGWCVIYASMLLGLGQMFSMSFLDCLAVFVFAFLSLLVSISVWQERVVKELLWQQLAKASTFFVILGLILATVHRLQPNLFRVPLIKHIPFF